VGDTGVDVREVMLAQVHRRAHDFATVVGDPPAPGVRDLGDQAVGMRGRDEEEWAAAGFEDTLLRCIAKPEVVYGNETAVQPRVQA